MIPSLVLAASAFVLCLALTPLVRRLCLKLGIVDRPDDRRKEHARPIARAGGVAVCISYAGAFAAVMLLPSTMRSAAEAHLLVLLHVLPAAGLVFITGLLDDIRELTPWQKLAGQGAAATAACAAGVVILGPGSQIAWWSYPLTLLWLVGCTNAFNLIDGLDGLAAGLGFFAAVTECLAAALQRNLGLALVTAPLAGCLLAFLRYNFAPASVFLGDSGSLLIGFLLGCFGVIWSQKCATTLAMTAPLMALAIPLLDTALAMVRRFLRNRPIFAPDRGHVHHRLLDRGLTPRRVALLLYAGAGVAAVFSLLQNVVRHQYAGLVLLLFCLVTVAAIHGLRFIELDVARQILFKGSLRRLVEAQIALRIFENRLTAAASTDQCWAVIRDGAREFGFVRVRLLIAGRDLEASFRQSNSDASWEVTIPQNGSAQIQFEHNQHYAGPALIGPFVEVVCRELQRRLSGTETTGAAAAVKFGS